MLLNVSVASYISSEKNLAAWPCHSSIDFGVSAAFWFRNIFLAVKVKWETAKKVMTLNYPTRVSTKL